MPQNISPSGLKMWGPMGSMGNWSGTNGPLKVSDYRCDDPGLYWVTGCLTAQLTFLYLNDTENTYAHNGENVIVVNVCSDVRQGMIIADSLKRVIRSDKIQERDGYKALILFYGSQNSSRTLSTYCALHGEGWVRCEWAGPNGEKGFDEAITRVIAPNGIGPGEWDTVYSVRVTPDRKGGSGLGFTQTHTIRDAQILRIGDRMFADAKRPDTKFKSVASVILNGLRMYAVRTSYESDNKSPPKSIVAIDRKPGLEIDLEAPAEPDHKIRLVSYAEIKNIRWSAVGNADAAETLHKKHVEEKREERPLTWGNPALDAAIGSAWGDDDKVDEAERVAQALAAKTASSDVGAAINWSDDVHEGDPPIPGDVDWTPRGGESSGSVIPLAPPTAQPPGTVRVVVTPTDPAPAVTTLPGSVRRIERSTPLADSAASAVAGVRALQADKKSGIWESISGWIPAHITQAAGAVVAPLASGVIKTGAFGLLGHLAGRAYRSPVTAACLVGACGFGLSVASDVTGAFDLRCLRRALEFGKLETPTPPPARKDETPDDYNARITACLNKLEANLTRMTTVGEEQLNTAIATTATNLMCSPLWIHDNFMSTINLRLQRAQGYQIDYSRAAVLGVLASLLGYCALRGAGPVRRVLSKLRPLAVAEEGLKLTPFFGCVVAPVVEELIKTCYKLTGRALGLSELGTLMGEYAIGSKDAGNPLYQTLMHHAVSTAIPRACGMEAGSFKTYFFSVVLHSIVNGYYFAKDGFKDLDLSKFNETPAAPCAAPSAYVAWMCVLAVVSRVVSLVVSRFKRQPEPQKPTVVNVEQALTGGMPCAMGTTMASICTRNLPNKPLRPGARLMMDHAIKYSHSLVTLQDKCCQRPTYRVAGPVCSDFPVVSFSTCVHNVRRGFTARAAGIPPLYNSVDEYTNRAALRERAIRRMWGYSHTLMITMAEHGCDGPHRDEKAMIFSPQDWVKRFPRGKADDLLNAYYSTPGTNVFDVMVKVEKSVLNVGLQEIADPGFWDQSEPIQTDLKMDPRIISVLDKHKRVQHSGICAALNNAHQWAYHGQFCYAPGMNPRELTRWFLWAYGSVLAGDIPWALVVQGDDSAVLKREDGWTPGGNVVFVSTDISRFDMSIDQLMLELTKDFQLKLLEVLSLETSNFEEFRTDSLARRRYNSQGMCLEVTGTQASGQGDTIVNNSDNVAPPVIFALNHNVGIVDAYEAVGMKCKAHTGVFYPGSLDLEFLQSRMYKCVWEEGDGFLFAPRIGRIIIRAFWVSDPLGPKKLKGHAVEVAIGLKAVANHVPIINDIADRISYLGARDKIRPHKCREQRRWESLTEFSATPVAEAYEHPDSETDIAALYDVSVDQVRQYRSFLRSWEWGVDISPPEHSDLVKAFYRIDLA
jgi:hypothetical protein